MSDSKHANIVFDADVAELKKMGYEQELHMSNAIDQQNAGLFSKINGVRLHRLNLMGGSLQSQLNW